MDLTNRGYAGKLLRIDLSKRKIIVQDYPADIARTYLGGTGLCAKILWSELNRDIKPFSKDNILIFATGPLNGTAFPPAGRFVIASKSPLTNIWAESHAGGFFGPELKYAGYDAIIIKGRAKKHVLIEIIDDKVTIRNAHHIWGCDTATTVDIIQEELGNDTQIASIGQGGENLVRFASVIVGKHRAAGRCGLGAIMGFKRLKAIAVKGSGEIQVYDFNKFMELVENARERYTKGIWGSACQQSLGRVGTPGLTELENEIGRLPTRNHWTGFYESCDKISSELIRNKFRKQRKSCFGCCIQCKYVAIVEEGKYAGTITEGPEYETVMAFGSNCMNECMESIIHANMLCNRYGLDTISTGKVISFVMECAEHKLIDYKIKWGDESKIVELIHLIAHRKGIGDILAEGSNRAAKKIGEDAKKFAIHVKGLEVSGQDGRAHKSIGLVHAISVRGADHLRAISCIEELGYGKVAKARYGKDAKDISNLRTETKKGILIVDMEDLYAIVDSLLICKYGTMWPPIFWFDDFCKIIPALTGFYEYNKLKEVRKLARRISLLRRAFNALLNVRRKDDTLPDRFVKEPMPSGAAKGDVVNLKPMLDEFYKVRGCNKRTGIPLKSALKKAGLKYAAEKIYGS